MACVGVTEPAREERRLHPLLGGLRAGPAPKLPLEELKVMFNRVPHRLGSTIFNQLSQQTVLKSTFLDMSEVRSGGEQIDRQRRD